MFDILGDYMSLCGYKFQCLDGIIVVGFCWMVINYFNVDDSDDFCFLFLICVGGFGINFMIVDIVIIFDFDWNLQVDLQVMVCVYCIGQKCFVNIYCLVFKEIVEEEVFE